MVGNKKALARAESNINNYFIVSKFIADCKQYFVGG